MPGFFLFLLSFLLLLRFRNSISGLFPHFCCLFFSYFVLETAFPDFFHIFAVFFSLTPFQKQHFRAFSPFLLSFFLLLRFENSISGLFPRLCCLFFSYFVLETAYPDFSLIFAVVIPIYPFGKQHISAVYAVLCIAGSHRSVAPCEQCSYSVLS